MSTRTRLLALSCLVLGACTTDAPPDAAGADQPASLAAAPRTEPVCQPQRATADRPSPYDSTVIRIDDAVAKVCYGRPSARGRQIFGGLLPYGQLWRTGANEPTTLHLPFAARIATIDVPPGEYSIYSIPDPARWTIIVNDATDQWGAEGNYTPEVEAQEVGRATVASETLPDAVEQFTIRTESAGENAANLILEWERTRVTIPIVRSR